MNLKKEISQSSKTSFLYYRKFYLLMIYLPIIQLILIGFTTVPFPLAYVTADSR